MPTVPPVSAPSAPIPAPATSDASQQSDGPASFANLVNSDAPSAAAQNSGKAGMSNSADASSNSAASGSANTAAANAGSNPAPANPSPVVSNPANLAPTAAEGAPPATTGDASTAAILQQIQTLLNSGVSISSISQTLAATLAQILQKTGAQSGKTDGDQAAGVAQILADLSAELQGTGAPNSGKPLSLQDAVAQLAKALSGNVKTTGGQSSGAADTAVQTAFLGRISNLLGLLQTGGKTGVKDKGSGSQASGGSDANAKPTATSQAANSQDTGTSLDALLAGVNSTAAQTVAATNATVISAAAAAASSTHAAGTSNASSSNASGADSAAVRNADAANVQSSAQNSAHEALGLEVPQNGSTGANSGNDTNNDVRVRSSAAPVNNAGPSTVLLRTLERAVNASLAGNGDSSSSSSGQAVFSALQRALTALVPNATAPAGVSGQVSAGATLLAALSNSSTAGVAAVSSSTSAAQAAAKVAPPLVSDDVHNLVSQIVTGVSFRSDDTSQSVRITLSPPHLGDITVNISVNSDRSVSATVSTNSSEVGNTVLANSDALTRAFSEAGVKLNHLGVDVSGQGMSNNQSRSDEQNQKNGARRFSNGSDLVDGVETENTPGPSLMDSSNLQLLNQLV